MGKTVRRKVRERRLWKKHRVISTNDEDGDNDKVKDGKIRKPRRMSQYTRMRSKLKYYQTNPILPTSRYTLKRLVKERIAEPAGVCHNLEIPPNMLAGGKAIDKIHAAHTFYLGKILSKAGEYSRGKHRKLTSGEDLRIAMESIKDFEGPTWEF